MGHLRCEISMQITAAGGIGPYPAIVLSQG
jgi:hypothetical protein